ncbi:MAG TPA: ribosomal protein S18-alanine N-acetyltransferase [Nitrospiria bacterium]
MKAGSATVSITPMVREDLDGVLSIEKASYSVPWTRSMFEVEIKGNPFSVLLVSRDGEGGPLTGYVCYWVVFDELHIMNLSVRPEYRRRGIGQALAAEAISDAWGKGVRLGTLEVRASNDAARGLYEKMGFKVEAVRKGYYREPREDALIMNLKTPREHLV